MRFMVLLQFVKRFMGGWDRLSSTGTTDGSRGCLVLAGSATRPLAGDHHSLEEELTTPDAPGLAPFECSVEAQGPDRAVLAEGLGELHVGGRFGKPQLRVVD